MDIPRTRSRRTPAALLASVVAASAMTLTGAAATAAVAAEPATPKATAGTLNSQDQERLAQAKAQGRQKVTVLVGAKQGQTGRAADNLAGLGAEVRYRNDTLGYLRVAVPTDRAAQIGKLAAVQTIEVDAPVELPDPRPDGAQPASPQPAPGATTPANNPYLPTGDTGAAQFVAAHPELDGRGVTVGVVDTGIDLAHPALQKTTTGKRKIIDWVTATHPTDDADPTWISMTTTVSGPSFTVDGRTYTAPGSGSYRFGVFDERNPNLGGELGNDVNRDGNPPGSSGLFGVLWDGGSTVWVDANQNGSFADQAAMTDYKENYDVGTFGTDNPVTAVTESIPFVVQIDGAGKFVNIGIVSGAHGSHVAGIIAGNRLFGGAMSGAAPGAKLVSIRVCLFVAGCTSHALIEGMIYAAEKANVDAINLSIGGLPGLNDGNNTRALLYNRLIEQHHVQMFISAGNSGPGTNTVGDPSVAEKVLSIGSYVSDATWRANYGSSSPYADNLHPFSSRGPREDGGFKPSVIAPGSAISTTPTWQAGGPVAGTYALPPGYAMFNGTSMASPQAAGVGALLVSPAKQEDVQHKPAQIRQALMSSARFIDNQQAYEQGAGLINAQAAYDLLSKKIEPVDITSSVPVNTTLSGFLATPNVGVGIHDREGVTIGKAYTRTYTLTRTTGRSTPISYRLSWVGNDGTFSTDDSSVALPLNTPVALTVKINPATAGAHSALLRWDDPATPGIDFQTMNLVVAPYTFAPAGNHQVTVTGSVGRNQALHYYFRVPAGTPALKVDFTGPSATAGTGQARFLRYSPWGLPLDSTSSTSCYSPSAGSCAGSPNSRTATNPMAGVWEATVEARRTSDAASTPFTMTVSILGAAVSPNPDVISSAPAGTPVSRSYDLTNTFGAFTGRAVGTTLGSARRGTYTIATGAKTQYDLTVSPGSTQLRATIGDAADPAADLDLYVYNCTSGTCVEAGWSADGDSEESVTIANPAAGSWRVIVDAYAVPSGSTTYNYVDVFTNPAFGSVSITDANAPRPSGALWTVAGTVTANLAPGTGRQLLGGVEVRTDSNVLIGGGDVVIETVS